MGSTRHQCRTLLLVVCLPSSLLALLAVVVDKLAARAPLQEAGSARLCCLATPITALRHLIIIQHSCIGLMLQHGLARADGIGCYQVAPKLGGHSLLKGRHTC